MSAAIQIDTIDHAPEKYSKPGFEEFTPMEYLKIDIASGYGLDKADWSERLAWVDEHIENGSFSDPRRLNQLIQEADEPAHFFAAFQAFASIQWGKKKTTGHMISLDATASGLQLLSLLIGCETSARQCNVVGTGKREDAYTNLNLCIRRLAQTQDIDPATVLRSEAKSAIMTSLYGSRKEPSNIYGPKGLLPTFYRVMEKEIPGAWKLNEAIMSLWDSGKSRYEWVLPDNFHAGFNVEANVQHFVRARIGTSEEEHVFTVHRKQIMCLPQGKSLCPNLIHSIDGYVVREVARRCMHDAGAAARLKPVVTSLLQNSTSSYRTKGKKTKSDHMLEILLEHFRYSGMLSARVLDHISIDNIGLVAAEGRDALLALDKLLNSLPPKSFNCISVHDCWRVHPRYGNFLRRAYNQVLAEIAASNLLQFTVSQAVGYLVPNVKISDLSAQVLEANYALS